MLVYTRAEDVTGFAAAVEQLANRALVGVPAAFFQTGAAHAFLDGIRDRELKHHLLKGGGRTLNEALKQAMKMEASKAAPEPPARLQKLTGELVMTSQRSDHRWEGRPVCWQSGSAGHLRRDRRRGPREGDQTSGNE